MEANSESNTSTTMEGAPHADFLARLDQELRPPLHAITGSAELIAMKLGNDDKVQRILKAARELLDIINRELTAPEATPTPPCRPIPNAMYFTSKTTR